MTCRMLVVSLQAKNFSRTEISYSQRPHKRRTTYFPDVKMSSILNSHTKKCAIQVVLRMSKERRWKKFLSIVSVWGSAKKSGICKLDWNENAKFFIACVLSKKLFKFLLYNFTILQLKKFNLKEAFGTFFGAWLCDKIYIRQITLVLWIN